MVGLIPYFEKFRLSGWKLQISIQTSPYAPEGVLISCEISSQRGLGTYASSFYTPDEVIRYLCNKYAICSR